MSDARVMAMFILLLAGLWMAGFGSSCFTGWHRIAFLIAAAICAAPAVVALFIAAVAG